MLALAAMNIAVLVGKTTPIPAGDMLAWRTDFTTAKQEAAADGRPLLVTITAVWCGACRQMQQLTLSESRVARIIQQSYIPVKIDADAEPQLITALGIQAFPTTLLVQADGQVRHRWVGYQGAAEFASELERHATTSSARPAVEAVAPPISALFPTNGTHVAFEGFCLVSLLDANKLRRGDASLTAEYRGQTVCFASDEFRQRFLRNPARFWPVANGNCLVTSNDRHEDSLGDPRAGVRWQGRLWFFADRERQQQFLRSPSRFSRSL
jgi:YHS domain-containing protein/thiol-disulfide isomerase/thioredoxin